MWQFQQLAPHSSGSWGGAEQPPLLFAAIDGFDEVNICWRCRGCGLVRRKGTGMEGSLGLFAPPSLACKPLQVEESERRVIE